MHISRRQFLKQTALLAVAATFPESIVNLQRVGKAHASGTITPSPRWLSDYIAALDKPHFAPLNDIYADIMGNNGNYSVQVYDILHGRLLSGVRTEAPLPVASAFKGPLLFYFLHVVDEAVWSSVPVRYWGEPDIDTVPDEYHSAWKANGAVLGDWFQTIVKSDNNSTGRVLAYLADYLDTDAPLVGFNDWSHDVVGVSQMSSLGAWKSGVPTYLKNYDERYEERNVTLNYQQVVFNNVMTARDLGLYYIWWQSQMSDNARRVGQELLSWIYEDRRSNIEEIAFNNGGEAYSKNGSLSQADTGVSAVVTDAGIVNLPDYGYFLVAYLTGEADTRTPLVFDRIGEITTGVYQDQVSSYNAAIDEDNEQVTFFQNYLEASYPEPGSVSNNGFNYAFVKHEGVQVYHAPDTNAVVRNPVISSSRFGVHLLMQGALARYKPYDNAWVELVPDSPRDNVQTKLGAPLFVRREDLHPISLEYSSLIPHFIHEGTTADDKMVVIDIQQREMTLFEMEEAVIKTPVVMNDRSTPRGGHVVTTKWLACSMQPWAPGVPFTTYFHVDGYAIHGSPWQRWEKTVTKENVAQRTSAGCVNVPNWTVQLGEYIRPLDELVFRWLGGSHEPTQRVFEYGTTQHPTVRVYVVDYPKDLNNYYRSPGMGKRGVAWSEIVDQMTGITVKAPDSFFTV